MSNGMLDRPYRKYVEAGIDRLDTFFGSREWTKQIDFDRLNMRSEGLCILGQLFSGYRNGLRDIETDRDTYDTRWQLGFTLPPNESGYYVYDFDRKEWQKLTKEWKRQLKTTHWYDFLTNFGQR